MGELLIERIPIEDYERVLPQKSFPRMPILYLELLENKTKVRKDLLNKLHKPPPPKPEPEPEPTRDTSFEQFQSSHAEEQVVDSSRRRRRGLRREDRAQSPSPSPAPLLSTTCSSA